MDSIRDKLSNDNLRVIAECLALVGVERPLIPGISAKNSALKFMSAYLRSKLSHTTTPANEFDNLQRWCELPTRCAEVINHRRVFGTKLVDYDTTLNAILKNY